MMTRKRGKDYFQGKNPCFSFALDLSQATPFQKRVWAQIATIPHGQTQTYEGIARGIGKPQAARAVGTALGKNPLPILIPCHRVIRCNGGLGGFSAAAGIDLKAELLKLEGAI